MASSPTARGDGVSQRASTIVWTNNNNREDVMNIFAGSIEIQMLCWSVALGLVQLVLATSLATKDQGLAYNLSPRDLPPPPVSPLAARLQRAFGNFRETFVYFAV